jgi:hypothetical protein
MAVGFTRCFQTVLLPLPLLLLLVLLLLLLLLVLVLVQPVALQLQPHRLRAVAQSVRWPDGSSHAQSEASQCRHSPARTRRTEVVTVLVAVQLA